MRGTIIIMAVAGLMLGACSTATPWRSAEYWQRASLHDAVYLDRVKAQELLNKDIAGCVVDVKDQERMSALREAMPSDSYPETKSPAGRLSVWDTPERDGYLMAEHLPFHDFESCMVYRGWERIETVTPDIAAKSRAAWLDHRNPDRVRNSSTRTAPAHGAVNNTTRKPSDTTSRGGEADSDHSYINF